MRSLFTRTTTQSSPLRGMPSTRFFRRVLDSTPCPLHKLPRYSAHNLSLYSCCASQDPALCSKRSSLQLLKRLHSNCYPSCSRITTVKPHTGNPRTQEEITKVTATQTNGPSVAMANEVKRRPSSELSVLIKRKKYISLPRIYGTSLFFIRPFTTASVPTHNSTSRRPATADPKDNEPNQDACYPMFVRLSETEDRICRLLDRVAKNYEDRQGKAIRLRIAGGWVRDKLLGLSCSDIDIGVESMMGYDFASLVADHLGRSGHHRKTIVRIASRPSRAKHLEAARMFILGIPIDFVNLRSEIYDDPNRFPREVVFGSPYEDAHHRDFTINALFYNIRTDKIEDYTGKGLEDLRDGWIRTPLKAFETFRQDPLRVLRGIRFAARFHFQMTEDVKQAILDPRIRGSLMTKVSKERIRDEIYKMLDDDAGRSTAIRLLHELGLHEIVFTPPEVSVLVKGVSAIDGKRHDLEDAFKLAWIMEWLVRINGKDIAKQDDNGIVFHLKDPGQEQLLKQTRGLCMTSHLHSMITTAPPLNDQADTSAEEVDNSEQQARRFLMLSALLNPYRDMTATHNDKVLSVAPWIHKYSLKARNNQVEITTSVMASIGGVQEAVNSITPSVPVHNDQRQREKAGMSILIWMIGRKQSISKTWPSAFLFGLGIELLPKYTLLRQGILDEESESIITKYNRFLSRTELYGIQECFSMQHIVDETKRNDSLVPPNGDEVTAPSS